MKGQTIIFIDKLKNDQQDHYTLSAISPPKTTLEYIKNITADFFCWVGSK